MEKTRLHRETAMLYYHSQLVCSNLVLGLSKLSLSSGHGKSELNGPIGTEEAGRLYFELQKISVLLVIIQTVHTIMKSH